MHRLRCTILVGDYVFLARDVTFPCFPYPGLHVGAHQVARVLVCQGDLDGEGDIEVEFKRWPDGDEGLLRGLGWQDG